MPRYERMRHGSWRIADGARQMARPFAIAISLQPFAMSLAGCGSAPPQPAAPPNILLVTIDTFPAHRLGTGVTPTIDRLAARGLRFTSARSTVPLTLPSHATILTGLLPPQHGVRENGSGALADAHPTIARLLKDSGYRT